MFKTLFNLSLEALFARGNSAEQGDQEAVHLEPRVRAPALLLTTSGALAIKFQPFFFQDSHL